MNENERDESASDAQSGLDPARYIRENFPPDDRLATVLLNKRANAVIQRLASAERIAGSDYLAWLHSRNEQGYEVYISMNALRPDAQNRTKGAIAAIRHIFLDLDENGTAALDTLLRRDDLPRPNYIINSSPDKWQVVWKVAGFDKRQAEELQRGLARECGADPAATDCARVLRLPGFYNHKYAEPFMVSAETTASEINPPDRFPRFFAEGRSPLESADSASNLRTSGRRSGNISQSERDWAYAKRALARGEPAYLVAAAIASYRRFDKCSPQDYAARTVAKAAAAVRADELRPTNVQLERR
jgi:hypothetical protein